MKQVINGKRKETSPEDEETAEYPEHNQKRTERPSKIIPNKVIDLVDDIVIDLTQSNNIDCSLCFNSFNKNFLACNHDICVDCVLTNMSIDIGQGCKPENNCPIKSCSKKSFDLDSIPVTTAAQKEKLLQIRLKLDNLCQNNASKPILFTCPNQKCSKPIVKSYSQIKSIKCDHCKTDYCSLCGDFTHEQRPCYFASIPNIGPCPNCKTIVSKDCSTAVSVTCSRCGYSWFWCCQNYWHFDHPELYKPGLRMTLAMNRTMVEHKQLAAHTIEVFKRLFVLSPSDFNNIIYDLGYLTIAEIRLLMLKIAKINNMANRIFILRKYILSKICIGIIDLEFAAGETMANQDISLSTAITVIDNKTVLLQNEYDKLAK